jgi:hypothetical protein
MNKSNYLSGEFTGHKETREITSIQRTDVKPETLGLTLAEGKMKLKDPQQVVVESQVSSLLLPKRTCPVIIRQHVADVADRLEQEMGDEQFCFVEGCQRSWDDRFPSNGLP